MTGEAPAVAARRKLRIGDLLVQHKVISEAQLQTALSEQKKLGRKLGRTLIELGFINEDKLLDFLAQQLQIPVVDLKLYKLEAKTVQMLPETTARRFRAVVIDASKPTILIGMSDPTDIYAYDEITRVLKKQIRLAVVREGDVLQTINMMYRKTDEISNLAEELQDEIEESGYDLEQMMRSEELTDAPVVKLLHSLFEDAVQVNASDIHIEPDETVLRIRQRIDGMLQEQVMKEKRIAPALVLRLKLMSGLDISEKRLPQDGRFNIKVNHKSIDVRVSTMPIQYGESVVMRLLDQSGGILSFDQLGMPEDILVKVQRLSKYPHGMILVTGPTGSGKTTTLYATLTELNTPERKIITVEDPVEYRLPRINQVQVHEKIGLSFANVLRTALRQDPDVVLVGEMRDQQTAEIGLRAAMTGHLVLSTLHTNDAITTANRLLDMGAEGYLIAATLKGIIAQRLVRRICDSCTVDYIPTPDDLIWMRSIIGEHAESITLKRGEGCHHCHNTGYRGRIGVYELLELNEPMADALRRNSTSDFVKAAKANPEFKTLTHATLEYAEQGVTTLEEVLRIAGDIDYNL